MNMPISDGTRFIYHEGGPPVGDVEKVLAALNVLHYVPSRSEKMGLYTVRGTQLSKAEEEKLRHQEVEMWRTAR